MHRYIGSDLGTGIRIALAANDNLGNFVVATPLMRMLRNKFEPVELWYFGGDRTRELEECSDLIDQRFSLVGRLPLEVASELASEPFDLVINLEQSKTHQLFAGALASRGASLVGPAIDPDSGADVPFQNDQRGKLWEDRFWADPNLKLRFPILDSGFIAEIFCRLCYLDGNVPRYELPAATVPIDVPDVLIATSASLEEKLWASEKWVRFAQTVVRSGRSVGLLGAPPKIGAGRWKGNDSEQALVDSGAVVDLRGRMTLPQVVGALGRAQRVVTLDNGIMHMSVSTSTPTVGLFRNGIDNLWLPPSLALKPIVAGAGEKVKDIPFSRVWEAFESSIRK